MKNEFAMRSVASVSRLSAVAMAAAAVAVASPAFAADKAWSTTPASNALSGTNFTAGTAAGAPTTTLANGDALYFGTSSVLVPNNDISGLSLVGITFNTGANAFTLSGNAITLTGNIVNNSTAFQTFNNAFTFNQNTTVGTNTGGININGPITGGTAGLAKIGTGLLGLLSANTYSGGTTVTGTLFAGNDAALGTGTVTINGTATGGAGSLSIGAGRTIANNIVINGGGFTGIGTIQVPDIGMTTLTGTITVNAAPNAGGIFTTAATDRILRIQGDNTITSTGAPISVRAGRVIYTGAQNYTTGTALATNDARASVQFSKIVSMPASGTVQVAQGNSILVNVGGAGEFTAGSGTTTAGTIGGLLGGVGGQGAPVTFAPGSTLGVDTSNATAATTYSSPWQGLGSVGLLKIGAGTLNLTAGGNFGTQASGGVAGFPLAVRQGELNLSGGAYSATGEIVVGGTFGTSIGATGFDAKMTIDGGSFTNSSWFNVGRGNGTGTVSSDVVANNTAITAGLFSLGYNGTSTTVANANRPKASVTLNNSSLTVAGTNFNFSESPGSTGTMVMNGSSSLNLTGTATVVNLGQYGNASITLNDTSSITSATNNANFFVGRYAGGTTRITLNGSSSLTQTGAAAGITLADGGVGVIDVASPAARVSSNALLIGHAGATTGVLLNKGSLLNLANGIFMGDGAGGYAYLKNDNGAALTPNATAGNIVAGITTNSYGVVEVNSGTLSASRAGGGFYQPVAANGQYIINGGTLTVGVGGFLNGDGAAGAKYQSTTVSGTGTLNVAGAINLAGNNDAGTNGYLSLSTGGTVIADSINATTTTGVGTAAMTTVNTNPFTVISANGGTLRANSGVATASAVLVGAGVDSIQVTGSGLTVDTNGLNKSIDTVITDPQNQGVQSISLSGTGTGFVGRPLVKIIDSTGSGATAVADWNPVTGEVTGITVTAPGSNYVQPAVTIYGGGGTAITGTAILDFSFGGGITKTGSGTLSLTGANTYTGTTVIKGGILKVKTAIVGPATTSAATPLLTSTAGTDIQAGGVIFDYTGDTNPNTQIRSLLAGSFTAGAGVMTAGQLRSTTATAKKGLGYRDDGNGNVLVKVALFGDADLDGGVSINDFNALAGNFGQASGKVWVDGDFDYDGGISINDFNLLAGNFGQSLPATSEAWAGLLAFAAANNDLVAFEAVTGVPEPTSLGLIAAGATLGLRRRRRAV